MTSVVKRDQQDWPLGQSVADSIRKTFVLPAESGHKLPTENELSGKYGVSVRTIRDAISVLANDGLVEKRQGSGTFVRDFKASQYVSILLGLGLDVPSSSQPTLAIAQHLLDWLGDHGHRGSIITRHFDDTDALHSSPFYSPQLVRDLERGLVSCVVSLSANPDPRWLTPAHQLNVPVVGTNSTYPYSVTHDALGAIDQGIRYLAKQGARRVAPVVWIDESLPDLNQPMHHLPERLGALARELGLTLDNRGFRRDDHPLDPGSGWRIVKELFSGSEKPDAILFNDDHYYRAGFYAVQELGLNVPGQVRLMTIANRGSEAFYPLPTDVLQFDPHLVGVTTAQMVDDLLNGREIKTPHRRLPVQLLPDQCSLSARGNAATSDSENA